MGSAEHLPYPTQADTRCAWTQTLFSVTCNITSRNLQKLYFPLGLGLRGRARFGRPSAPAPMAVLVVSSRRLLVSLPAMPLSALASALLRVSLAFTSTARKPISLRYGPRHQEAVFPRFVCLGVSSFRMDAGPSM